MNFIVKRQRFSCRQFNWTMRNREQLRLKSCMKFSMEKHINRDEVQLKDNRIVARLEKGAQGVAEAEGGTLVWVQIDGANRDWYLNKLEELRTTRGRIP